MPRNSRNEILESNSYVHILIEGIPSLNIFKSNYLKKTYLNTINEKAKINNVIILGYTLMDNFSHFIFYIKNVEDLSNMLKSTNLSYSKFFNKQFQRKGIIYNGRYKSEILSNNSELISCLSFIHKLPYTMLSNEFQEMYEFSSLKEYISKSSTFVNFTFLNFMFGDIPQIPITTKLNFMNVKINNGEDIEIVLKEIVERYNITSLDRLKNDSLLYLIVKELKVRTQLSLREIAKVLQVSREKVRKLMTINL